MSLPRLTRPSAQAQEPQRPATAGLAIMVLAAGLSALRVRRPHA